MKLMIAWNDIEKVFPTIILYRLSDTLRIKIHKQYITKNMKCIFVSKMKNNIWQWPEKVNHG